MSENKTTDENKPADAPPPYSAPYPTSGQPPYPTAQPAYPPQPQPYPAQPPPQGQVYYVGTQPATTTTRTTTVVAAQPTTTTVLVRDGNCPNCRIGYLHEQFTCCGLLLAIFFFPLGIICCLLMRHKVCTHCGAIF